MPSTQKEPMYNTQHWCGPPQFCLTMSCSVQLQWLHTHQQELTHQYVDQWPAGAPPMQHLLSPCHAHNAVQVNTLHSCSGYCRSNYVLVMNKCVLLLVLASCSSSMIQEHAAKPQRLSSRGPRGLVVQYAIHLWQVFSACSVHSCC